MTDFVNASQIKLINSLEDFLACSQEHSGQRGWIFRGEENFSDPLQSALERYCTDNGFSPKDAGYHEYLLTREFRRRAHHYLTDLPGETDYLEWWSLMRHYGAPTRLLDWTYSFDVATYFALEKKLKEEERHIVWGMNMDWAADKSCELLRAAGKDTGDEVRSFLRGPIELNYTRCFFDVFLNKPFIACAYPLTPFRLNERLTIQKGLFLIPRDVTKSFKGNLRDLPGYQNKENFEKIVIPSNLRKEILRHLHQMNMSRATLFPDLDGFAKSLEVTTTIWSLVSLRSTKVSGNGLS